MRISDAAYHALNAVFPSLWGPQGFLHICPCPSQKEIIPAPKTEVNYQLDNSRHIHLEPQDRWEKQRLLWGVWGIWGIWWVWGSQARSVKRRLSSSSCLFLVFIIAHLTESQKLPFGLLMYLLVNIMAPPSAMIEAIHYNCVYLEGRWQGREISVTQKMGDDRASDLWARERGPRIARLTLQMHRMWNWRRRPETSSLDSTHTPQTSCNSKNFDF